MSENEKTFLCGGVLFFMLMKATFPDGSARDHRDGVRDEHKAPDVMSDLVYTFTGSRSYGSEKDTSNYRECKIEGTVNVPFNDESIVVAYDDTVRNRYSEALRRMHEFITWHINPAMKEWLVRALLEVVEYDTEIKDDDLFYAASDGSGVTKIDLHTSTDYALEPFLVGLLHYLLMYRAGRNQEGQSTLELYGSKKPYKERVHNGNAGRRITRHIVVSRYEKDDTPISQPEEDDQKEQSASENFNGEGTFEEDVFRESETASDVEGGEAKITVVQHQTNVIQNGENNFNLTNNGVMNFDFGGGKK